MMPKKIFNLTPEQEAMKTQIEGLRYKVEQLMLRPPESRAQMKAERKRLYQALENMLLTMWSYMPYENMMSAAAAGELVKAIERRLKIDPVSKSSARASLPSTAAMRASVPAR